MSTPSLFVSAAVYNDTFRLVQGGSQNGGTVPASVIRRVAGDSEVRGVFSVVYSDPFREISSTQM